jgi:Endomembrane protein 70
MSRYANTRFLPSSFEIHWLSIINSFVLVLLLTAFLTIILLRVLKNDFSRYMELDDDAMEEEEVSLHCQNMNACLICDKPRLTRDVSDNIHCISPDGSLFTAMSFGSPTLPVYFARQWVLETS